MDCSSRTGSSGARWAILLLRRSPRLNSRGRTFSLMRSGRFPGTGIPREGGDRTPNPRPLACSPGHRSELEERMAPSLIEILLGRVVDTDPIACKYAYRWPEPRSQQRTQQARAPVRLERAPEDGGRLVRR